MRFVNAAGRAGILVGDQVFDLAAASGGAISADPMVVLSQQWDDARALAHRGAFDGGTPAAAAHLGPPVPDPRAVYAVGLNYRSHAAETGLDLPDVPAIFAKFPTAITGPHDDVVLPEGESTADWEAELAFVVAGAGRRVPRERALDAVLGFTCAQDVSERRIQFAAMRQFAMGKSFDTFCPTGPAIVTLDEVPDPGDVRVRCRVNGEVVQDGRTSDLVFDVPALVEWISSVCTLRAGDLCLTGTPAGVGMARTPEVYLRPGDVIETEIEGVGRMRNRCVAER